MYFRILYVHSVQHCVLKLPQMHKHARSMELQPVQKLSKPISRSEKETGNTKNKETRKKKKPREHFLISTLRCYFLPFGLIQRFHSANPATIQVPKRILYHQIRDTCYAISSWFSNKNLEPKVLMRLS